MKKIASLTFVTIIVLLLSACDPGIYQIDADSLNDVISIELIDYENSKQKHFLSWVPNQFDKLSPFDNANATVIEELEEDKVPDFINAFAQTDILHIYYAYDSPKDVCVKMNYSNGNFLIVWANYKEENFAGYIGEYFADGTVFSFWGSFSSLAYFENLVNDFFDFGI